MHLHPWNLTPLEAIQLQKGLAQQVIRHDAFDSIKTIAGADLALSPAKTHAVAAFIVYEFPSLKEKERVFASGPLRMDYIPGLLSFREGPILELAFAKLKNKPDLILFDGHGIAHPRRLGIASHMGLRFDRPSIGCGKSLLCGTYPEPDSHRKNYSLLRHHDEVIGAVLRTKEKVKPIFISIGHRISLESAIQIVLQCHDGWRLPLPTHEADRWVGELKKVVFKDDR